MLLVVEAKCCWLWRLSVAGCGGYVLLVVEAKFCWLWRLSVRELKNENDLSPARASLLGLSLAI